jgi:hypothetical protein
MVCTAMCTASQHQGLDGVAALFLACKLYCKFHSTAAEKFCRCGGRVTGHSAPHESAQLEQKSRGGWKQETKHPSMRLLVVV